MAELTPSTREAARRLGQRMKALEINRQRVNVRSKRRRRRVGGCRGPRLEAARHAAAGETTMANHMRFHRRYLDLVVFADQIHVGVRGKRSTTALAHDRVMVVQCVRVVRKPTIVRLMPGLRTARPRALAFFLFVRRRRLRGGAQCLVRTLERQHKLDHFFLAQTQQISAIHPHIDSEIRRHRKEVGNYATNVKSTIFLLKPNRA